MKLLFTVEKNISMKLTKKIKSKNKSQRLPEMNVWLVKLKPRKKEKAVVPFIRE